MGKSNLQKFNSSHSTKKSPVMAYFNQNNDGNYKAYYKPKQAPGGTSSIMFGDDTPVSTNKKQESDPNYTKTAAQLEKENSRPNSDRSGKSEVQESGCQKEVKDEGVTSTKREQILPKANDIFGNPAYGDGAPKNTKGHGYRTINPPGGKSSGPLW